MSYGYTPYDKKSYKGSKKQRRQALIAARTGKIMPYGSVKRRIIIFTALLALLLIVGGAVFAVIFFNGDSDNNIQANDNVNDADLLNVVNIGSPLDADYVPKLEKFHGLTVNSLITESLSDMFEKAEGQGVALKIKSAYVSYDDQKILYEKTLSEFLSDPELTKVRAEAMAQKVTAQAGCSESQTGLIVDFEFADDRAKAFVERNCVSYGFVLRYPEDKTVLTRRAGSETIYRYVGRDNAVKMRSFEMCLEEYKDYLIAQGTAY